MSSPSYHARRSPLNDVVAVVDGKVYRETTPRYLEVMAEVYGDYRAIDFDQPKPMTRKEKIALQRRKYERIKQQLGEAA